MEAVRGAKIVFIGEVEPVLRILTFTNPKGMNILSYVIMVLRKCVRRINFLEMNGLNPFFDKDKTTTENNVTTLKIGLMFYIL